MTYDRARRNALVDKFYADTLSLEESRELKAYIESDVRRLERTPGALRQLMIVRLLDRALFARIHLMARAEAAAGEA